MNLQQIGQLLDQFTASDWSDLYVRTAEWTLFVAKPGSTGRNPMLEDETGAQGETAGTGKPVGAEITVSAPHVGTVTWLASSASMVEPGEVIARLEVLGEDVEIKADSAARVTAVLQQIGALAEYDAPLLLLSTL